MSTKPLEIYTVMGDEAGSALIAKVWIEKHGDLYVTKHAPGFMSGKYSYHESGVTHTYTDLIERRSGEGEHPHPKLRGMKGHAMINAFGCPRPVVTEGYLIKPNTKTRRTLVTPPASIGFYWHLWAIERGRRDLATRIAATNPWPAVPVVSSLLADWTDPWLLVTVSHWLNEKPYSVVRYEPAIMGRVPYEIIPDAFEGTWLEGPGPKWRPGQPFPVEWLKEAVEHEKRYRAFEERMGRRERAE